MAPINRFASVALLTVATVGQSLAASEFPSLGFVPFGEVSPLNDIRSVGNETFAGRPRTASEGRVSRIALTGGIFVPAGVLAPTGSGSGAEFGIAVDVDGDLMVVGEGRGAASAGSGIAGVARAFERIAGTWVEASLLLSPLNQPSEWFGQRTAVAGSVLAVAAPGWQSAQGRVYIYRKLGANWAPQGAIAAFDGSSFDNFGYSIDGAPGLLVVGAPQAEPPGGVFEDGAAYVFAEAAGVWTQTQVLTGVPAARGQFGLAVATDGDTIAIGAGTEGDGVPGVPSGAVYIFERDGAAWALRQRIGGDVVNRRTFGVDVSVRGNVLCVGSQVSLAGNQGEPTMFIFERRSGTWIHTGTIPNALVTPPHNRCAISDEYVAVGALNSEQTSNGVRFHPATEAIFSDGFEE